MLPLEYSEKIVVYLTNVVYLALIRLDYYRSR